MAKDFSIINQPTKAIIIPFEQEGELLVERLQNKYYFPNRDDYKKAQRLSVQVMDKVLDLLVGLGAVVDARGTGSFIFCLTQIFIVSIRDYPRMIRNL